MEVKLLEHVNLRTTEIEKLEEWYIRILGLKKGYRPPFSTKGTWLYAADIPMIHLVDVNDTSKEKMPRMEHFCMRATGLQDFLNRLKENDIPYETVRVPELRVLQVHLSDPDDNHLHIDFPPEEADQLGFE